LVVELSNLQVITSLTHQVFGIEPSADPVIESSGYFSLSQKIIDS